MLCNRPSDSSVLFAESDSNRLIPTSQVMEMHRTAVVIALLLVLCCTKVQADSWAAATAQARASENGQFVVRVVPGVSKGDVVGIAGEPKGRYASAEWHKFNGKAYQKMATAVLLNPIAPVDIEVTNDGMLITFDNWHNRGIGSVVVLYKPDGTIFKKYTLQDLYSKSDLARINTSVSSINWRCSGFSTSLEPRNQLWIDDSLGGRFEFDLKSGRFDYQRGGGTCR